MKPVQIFIGYDSAEPVAYHVLAHSIMTRASIPVSITPIGNEIATGGILTRGRQEHDSTEFSNARFMVPYLAQDADIAIFMDCDMLCLADIADLVAEARNISDPWTVMVKQHRYTPKNTTKFLGQENATYSRKNWSSLMVFNLRSHAVNNLSPEYVNTADGLHLHQFAWCPHSHIIPIAGEWNMLVGIDDWAQPKLVHFTNGGPWHGHCSDPAAGEWMEAFFDMLCGKNPMAAVPCTMELGKFKAIVEYGG